MLCDAHESHKRAVDAGPSTVGPRRPTERNRFSDNAFSPTDPLAWRVAACRTELARTHRKPVLCELVRKKPATEAAVSRARIRILATKSIRPSDKMIFNNERNKLEEPIKPICYKDLACGTPKLKICQSACSQWRMRFDFP